MFYKSKRKYGGIYLGISIITILFLISTIIIKLVYKNKAVLVNNDLSIEIYDNEENRYLIGEEVKLDDSILKVNNIEIYKFDDKKEYLVLNVTIRNIGNKEIDYNPFYFKLENNSGIIMEEISNDIGEYNFLKSCKISSGKEINGSIAFDLPEDRSQLMLIYKTNLFSQKEVKIKLS